MMLIRFLAVGVVNTAVGLGLTFGVMHGWGWSYWPATLTGLAIGALVSFFLNRWYTFRVAIPTGGALVRFMLVISGSYVLAYAVSYQLTKWLLVPLGFKDTQMKDAAVLLGMAGYSILNYFGQKHLVFRVSKAPSSIRS